MRRSADGRVEPGPEDERDARLHLEQRLRAILPETYQDTYEDVQPVSMGSAGLKYDANGLVAWDEMWATFCDLAMAGGPPHKGTLLEPAPRAEIDAAPERYQKVVDELCRGVVMVTGLGTQPSPNPGWIRVDCFGEGMTGWLLRAIVMENVSVRREGRMLDLPAGPAYRLEKEIKNVITVIAKTCHYWTGHMPSAQRRDVANLFTTMAEESPLVEPAVAGEGDGRMIASAVTKMRERIHRETGLLTVEPRYAGWLGVECASIRAAVWMMRGMVASNVLSRREGTVLFVPVNPGSDPAGDIVVRTLSLIHRLCNREQPLWHPDPTIEG